MTGIVVFMVAVIVVGFGIGLYCQSLIAQSEGNVKAFHDLARWEEIELFHEPTPSDAV